MVLRRILIRGILLAAVAAALALATRDLAVRFVAHHLADTGSTLAEVAQKISGPLHEETMPPAPAPVDTVTLPALATTSAPPPRIATETGKQTGALAPKAKIPTSPSVVVPAPLRVTRAEVDAAISSKVYGARTKLARDPSGKAVGLALYGTGALARFGVQDGDVLVSANGYALRTPEEAFAAVGSLKDAICVTVVLRRGAGSYAVTVEVAPPK